MAKKFEDLEIGDQLEQTNAHCVIYGSDKYDPNQVRRVAIVTHIWYDPVEDKNYVGIAYLRRDGSYGKPTEKRTFRGLAQTGWRLATMNWIEHLATLDAKGSNVVSLWGKQ